ncbi:hypothetical protein IFR05_003348 [Cadophora sp. M221]|nr:hypothetical protein IFR05_003348 [Cadophora sp. M221]
MATSPAIKFGVHIPSLRQRKLGTEGFISYASWTNTSHGALLQWSRSARLEVRIGGGSGQILTPFSVSAKEFRDVCTEFEFSQLFLEKLVAKAALFEHQFNFSGFSGAGKQPTHLEIAMAVYENDAFLCLLRYDIEQRTAKCLVFVKEVDYLKHTPLEPCVLSSWLDENEEILQRHPLMILNVILRLIQFRAHEYVRWRMQLYNMESRLGVTRDADTLMRSGYAEVCYDFGILNADVAGLAKSVADTKLSASTILAHTKSLQRLIGICEECEVLSAPDQVPLPRLSTSEQREELEATITRAELYLGHIEMVQGGVLQSLTAVLYNRISKQENQSVKAISVVALVFVPPAFVSAVFSTGIFDFHATEPKDQPRTVSKYGWIYLLACVVCEGITLLLWVCWHRWIRVWWENLEFLKMHSPSLEGKHMRKRASKEL